MLKARVWRLFPRRTYQGIAAEHKRIAVNAHLQSLAAEYSAGILLVSVGDIIHGALVIHVDGQPWHYGALALFHRMEGLPEERASALSLHLPPVLCGRGWKRISLTALSQVFLTGPLLPYSIPVL